MSKHDHEQAEMRLLMLVPTPRDASLAGAILADAGIASFICRDVTDLTQQVSVGAGTLLLAEEVLAEDGYRDLCEALSQQPAWSDLPILILSRPGADSQVLTDALTELGNVAVLERPTRVAALVSAVRTALRARKRQYQMRGHLRAHERTEDALREAHRRKDEFLATLSHELRNPLAPISNGLQVLRTTVGDQADAARTCDMIERQVRHLVTLVDDLLDLSRITRGKVALRKEMIALADIVRDAVETTRPLLDAAQHTVEVGLPDEPLVIHGDRLRLGQVFANILNNAGKYSERPGRISISGRRAGNAVVVTVRDSGIGIPPDVLPHVFDMFVQAPHSATRAMGGLGIGLTLCRNLIEMHGGQIAARSDGAGQGTAVVVTLPLAVDGVITAREPAAATRAPSPLRGRILVVDDNRDAADSLGMLLEMSGATVRVEHDGASALRAVEEYEPGIVVLDIGMPDMDGCEVARRIRGRNGSHNPTLIALTGWGQEEDRRRCQLAGFDHHMTKPVDLGALATLLASIAAGAHAREMDRV